LFLGCLQKANKMKKFLLIILILSIFLINGCVQKLPECSEEGQPSWNSTSGQCCEGLNATIYYTLIEGECIGLECGYGCINCGNGICGSGEDMCNCPEDCEDKEPEECP